MAIKLKIFSGAMFFFLVVIWAVFAFAAVGQMSSPSWYEHVDLMQVAVVGLFSVFIWFSVRTLKAIESKVKAMDEKQDKMDHRLSLLEGAHEARTSMGIGCK